MTSKFRFIRGGECLNLFKILCQRGESKNPTFFFNRRHLRMTPIYNIHIYHISSYYVCVMCNCNLCVRIRRNGKEDVQNLAQPDTFYQSISLQHATIQRLTEM